MPQEHQAECELISLSSASEFLNKADDFLYRHEDLRTPIIAAASLVEEQDPVFKGPFAFAIARNERGDIVGCTMHAYPDGLLISGLDVGWGETIYEWADATVGVPRRISGPSDLTADLVARWKANSSYEIDLENDWRIWRLDNVDTQAEGADGVLRLGHSDEEGLVEEWGEMYSKEKPAFLSISAFFARKLGRRELFVWDDNGAKTVVTVSAKTRNGIRISGVFTPPGFRGKGYAGTAVTKVCKKMLDEGRSFVTLVTSRDDPVERLYKRIGFKRIGSQTSVTLKKSPS